VKKTRRLVAMTVLLLLLGSLPVACSSAPYQCLDPLGCLEIPPGSPLVIGTLLASAGPQSRAGGETLLGIRKAVDETGDLLGHPIELDEWDTDCSEKDARTGAINLGMNSALVAVIGPTCAGQESIAAQILNDVGIPLLTPAPGSTSGTTLTRRMLSTIEQVAVQDADGTLHIPRQALLDALEQIP
jgi:ABC-type branched-subunit amino acid transport system substrate-binding protein